LLLLEMTHEAPLASRNPILTGMTGSVADADGAAIRVTCPSCLLRTVSEPSEYEVELTQIGCTDIQPSMLVLYGDATNDSSVLSLRYY
jgi:hypothetical protein